MTERTVSKAARVRRIRPHEWRELRELRLRALQDAPTAFETTHAQAAALPDAEWIERARLQADGGQRVTYVAVDATDRWLGMCGGDLGHGEPRDAELTSMWIAPEARGQGAGDALVEAVAAWSRAHGVAVLRLWVTEGNAAAERLYLRNGFSFTGHVQPLAPWPPLNERMMARPMAPPARGTSPTEGTR